MNRNVGIATGVGIAIIIGVIAFQVSNTMWDQVSVDEYYEKGGKVAGVVYPDNPQILGPLQINKDKYLLGEHVYVILRNLQPGDTGAVQFFTPGGILYEEMGFNGAEREFQKKSILSLMKNYKKTFQNIYLTETKKNNGIYEIQKTIYGLLK